MAQTPAARAAPRTPPRPTPLHPKEHGAYAIVAIPLVAALLTAGLTPVGVAIALATVAGFFAHEPLLVLWGHRGSRARQAAPTVVSRLILLSAAALVAGGTAMLAAAPVVRWALLACAGLAALGFALSAAGRHRTLAGQLAGVVGLSSPSVPISLAGGLDLPCYTPQVGGAYFAPSPP